MRIVMMIVGAILLLIGIFLEGMYLAKTIVLYNGAPLLENTFLASGIVLLLAGLLFVWAGLKIPKVQSVKP